MRRLRKSLEKLILAAMHDKKAENIVIIDVRKQLDWADRFFLCTAPAEVHRRIVANEVLEKCHTAGIEPVGRSGIETGSSWTLIDFGDTVVHIFSPDARKFYDLERTWGYAGNLVVVK